MTVAALTAQRITGAKRFIERDFVALAAGAAAYPGATACLMTSGANAGYYEQGQTGSGNAVGRFTGLCTPSSALGVNGLITNSGANGAVLAEIENFNPYWVFLFDNDTVAPVVAADRGQNCYVLVDHAVTMATFGNGVAGIVYDVVAGVGVWVRVKELGGGAQPGVSAGSVQCGTATLVAGTVAITAANIDAGSLILLTIRDPGAGVLTTFIGLDAPVASRVAGAAGAGGSFTVNALANDKTTLATAVCTFDWAVLN
jgi:hypothetical protein